MSKTLYLECNSGIAGDMMVAALLDLGADQKVLMQALESIPAEGYRIEISRVKKAGIDCCDFHVVLDQMHENHDHDMQYLHGDLYGHEIHDHEGHEHTHDHEHAHEGYEHTHDHEHAHEDHEHMHDHEHAHEGHEHEGQEHTHDQEHAHEDHEHMHEHEHAHEGHEHTHGHEHRGMAEISEILARTELTDKARELAVRIFDILAAAEAKAHAVPVEQVHFHEVGAIDSIVDIVAVAVCMDNLGIEEVIVPKICEGTGTVRCQHGILPVPVPAVTNIIEAHQLPIQITNVQGEFVTPTGAAIVAAIRTSGKLPEIFTIEKIGIGAGKRTYEKPSLLRAMLIRGKEAEEKNISDVRNAPNNIDQIYKLESNIDDCSGEVLGYVMEQLFSEGARDVHYTPVYMKKNRPGWQLNVICSEEDVERLEQIIFKETTTIGIRRLRLERSVLEREIITVETPYGKAVVKKCFAEGVLHFYPEYESVAAISKNMGIPYIEVYHNILDACGR